MLYLLLKFVHLTAAACFIGGVFFEVMILSRAARQLDEAPRAQLSRALGQRARQVMHWVVLALYGAGVGLAWHYRAALAQPFASSFGTLLTLKICLALSILGHVIFQQMRDLFFHQAANQLAFFDHRHEVEPALCQFGDHLRPRVVRPDAKQAAIH